MIRQGTVQDQQEGHNMTEAYPDYCRTIRIQEANGSVKELVFPKSLDLERPKRARTTFSSEQLYGLENAFHSNQYVVGKERTQLAGRLQLSETQVKVWFQNRRTKFKRDMVRDAEVRTSKSESFAVCNILRMLQHECSVVPQSVMATASRAPVVPQTVMTTASRAPVVPQTVMTTALCAPVVPQTVMTTASNPPVVPQTVMTTASNPPVVPPQSKHHLPSCPSEFALPMPSSIAFNCINIHNSCSNSPCEHTSANK